MVVSRVGLPGQLFTGIGKGKDVSESGLLRKLRNSLEAVPSLFYEVGGLSIPLINFLFFNHVFIRTVQ